MKWKFIDLNKELIKKLNKTIQSIPESIIKYLVSLNYDSEEKIHKYLYSNNIDSEWIPELKTIANIDDAYLRIKKAIDTNETVIIFGDFDSDGITATAVMYEGLRELGINCKYYIPDRNSDGYGLSASIVKYCKESINASLMITVDCGTNDGAAVKGICDAGIDVIVTDHHEPKEMANPTILINPKINNTDYKDICGCGVAFCVLQYVYNKIYGNSDKLKKYLDLVAIATVADMMPLRGVNRVFVKAGLKQLEQTEWVGLKQLCEVSKIKLPISSYDIGFKLAPRINAAGRVDHPYTALSLILSKHKQDCIKKAISLDSCNKSRKDLEHNIYTNISRKISSKFDPNKDFCIIVHSDKWQPGIVGIVAARLVREFNVPAIVFNDHHGLLKGSCRSINGFDILAGLAHCSKYLISYGGHKAAAGVSVSQDNLEIFKKEFNKYCKSILKDVDLEKYININSIVNNEDFNKLMEYINLCKPFGNKNPEPVWCANNVSIVSSRIIGGSHLSLLIQINNNKYGAILFNQTTLDIGNRSNVDVVFKLDENIWNGKTSLQLKVVDIKDAKFDIK